MVTLFNLFQILRLSSRYDQDSDTMVFSGGMNVNRDQLESAGFGSLTDTIFRFARSLRDMDVDEMELAALCSICLISGGKLVQQILVKIAVNIRANSYFCFVLSGTKCQQLFLCPRHSKKNLVSAQ